MKKAPVKVASFLDLHEDQHEEHAEQGKGNYAANVALFKQRIKPVPGAKVGSYEEVSRIISRTQFNELTTAERGVVRDLLMEARAGHPGRSFCFAPGTNTKLRSILNSVTTNLDPGAIHAEGRWTRTATNPAIARSQGFTLTWNIMPDGAPMGSDKSSLIAWGIKNFGSEEKMRQAYRDMFARWSQLTSITYVEVDYDDQPASELDGELGVRADIRIGGRDLSSTPGVLAVNAFPNGGEMTMGTNWTYDPNTNADNGFFNVTGHEHGHGIGLAHGCPQNGTKLMEPALNGGFRGPQLDDWLGAQFNYGDQYEKGSRNNTPNSATNLGMMQLNSETIIKEVSLNIGDVDLYRINPDNEERSVTAVLKPFGAPYLDGKQLESGCEEGTLFSPNLQRNLDLEIVNAGGDVLATSAASPEGGTETITDFDLTGSGPYYARVSTPDTADKIQAYTLSFKIGPRRNRPPQISYLRFNPERPETKDILKAEFDWTDPDGDTVTPTTIWKKNGQVISVSDNAVDLSEHAVGDVFEVTLNLKDNKGSTNSATIKVTVRPPNQKPVFPDTAYSTDENKVLNAKFEATDANTADPNAEEPLTYTIVKKPKNGTVELGKDGNFTYTPKLNFNGPDTFVARVSDPWKGADEATITINVKPVAYKPVLQDDIIKTKEDVSLSISAETLFSNDNNGEAKGEDDPMMIVGVTPASNFPGTLKLDKVMQTILFTPTPNWNGTTSFTYTVVDSANLRSTAKVTLQVAAVNDAPTAKNLSVQTIESTPIEVELVGADVEGDVASFSLVNKPADIKASISHRGDKWYLLYKPASGFVGTVAIQYCAKDGFLASEPATVTIKVTKNSLPKLHSLTPTSGNYKEGATVVFTQQVRDTNGVGHMDAVSLLFTNSSSGTNSKNGAALWYDVINNVFTVSTDDGKSTYTPMAVGKKLYNSQVSVELRPEDIIRGSDGILTLKWRVTFQKGYVGTKTLWSFVEDRSGATAGYAVKGTITIGSSTSASTSANGS